MATAGTVMNTVFCEYYRWSLEIAKQTKLLSDFAHKIPSGYAIVSVVQPIVIWYFDLFRCQLLELLELIDVLWTLKLSPFNLLNFHTQKKKYIYIYILNQQLAAY